MKDLANGRERERERMGKWQRVVCANGTEKRTDVTRVLGPRRARHLDPTALVLSWTNCREEVVNNVSSNANHVVIHLSLLMMCGSSATSGWKNDRRNVLAPRIPNITRSSQQVAVSSTGWTPIFVDQYASPTDFSFPRKISDYNVTAAR